MKRSRRQTENRIAYLTTQRKMSGEDLAAVILTTTKKLVRADAEDKLSRLTDAEVALVELAIIEQAPARRIER